MRLMQLEPENLVVTPELSRSTRLKQFEDRLRASIEEVGLAEPIKVAPLPDGTYLIVDGVLRFQAVQAIRAEDPRLFGKVPAYVVDYERRYELRYQTDIYQDLLPSQLATLVEHLKQSAHVRKIDIARYIGVSPTTLRNYTGLWRLLQRGELFARLVELMDVEVVPSSNPYAWLRLSDEGLRMVLEQLSDSAPPAAWIEDRVNRARRGDWVRIPIKTVEEITGGLTAEYYRQDEESRNIKRDLGLRRAKSQQPQVVEDAAEAMRQLKKVVQRTHDAVLRSAARSFLEYLT
jgi:ParB-like chromosome segregation protein Spo0J